MSETCTPSPLPMVSGLESEHGIRVLYKVFADNVLQHQIRPTLPTHSPLF